MSSELRPLPPLRRPRPRVRPAAIRYDRPFSFPGCERLVVDRSRHLWSLYHDRVEIWWISDVEPDAAGERWLEWQQRGREMRQSPPFLLVAAPGDLQRWVRASGRVTLRGLVLAGAWMERLQRTHDIAPPSRWPLCSTHAASLTHMARLHAAWDAGEAVEEGRVRTVVARVLGRSPRVPLEAGRPLHPAVAETRGYLESSVERIPLSALAGRTGFSAFYVQRRFTAELGLSPHAYQLRVRLAAARTLLSEGVPITDIDLGFADQSHLTRHYRRVLGVTPGRYVRWLAR